MSLCVTLALIIKHALNRSIIIMTGRLNCSTHLPRLTFQENSLIRWEGELTAERTSL